MSKTHIDIGALVRFIADETRGIPLDLHHPERSYLETERLEALICAGLERQGLTHLLPGSPWLDGALAYFNGNHE